MRTAICRLDLGFTRVAGFTIFNEETKEFEETTPRSVKDLIKQAGGVNGLRLNKDGEIELDREGFNMHNLMVKSAVGRYRTLYPTTSIINCMYAVVRVIENDNGKVYEIINNKCGRVKVTPEKLKVLMQVGSVAGVKMGADGEIEICEGITIENRRTQIAIFESGLQNEESLKDVSIEAVMASSVEGHEKAAEKSAESVDDVTTNPVVQDANGLEIVFDSIGTLEVHAEVSTTSADTSINLANAEENVDKNPPTEHIEQKKSSTPQRKGRNKS